MTSSALVNCLVLLSVSFLVFLVCLALVRRRNITFSESLVIASVLSLAHFIGIPLFLSFFRSATPANTVVASLCVLVFEVFAFRLKFAEVTQALRCLSKSFSEALRNMSRLRLVYWPLSVFVLVLIAKTATVLLIRPYTSDAHTYHLPMALNILRNGHYVDILGNGIEKLALHELMNGYGKNLAFLFFWVLGISRNEVLLLFVSLCSAPVAVAAVYSICRRHGVSREAAVFAAPLAVFNYFSVIQMSTCMPDQFLSTLIVIAVLFSLRSITCFNTFMLGVVCGIVAGAPKPTLALTCSIIAAFYIARLLVHRSSLSAKELSPCRLLVHCALLCAPVVIFGAYQFLHNVIVFGNPLYPFSVRILDYSLPGVWTARSFIDYAYPTLAGQPVIAGLVPSVFRMWGNFSHSSRIGGWGLLFPLVFLPAHLFAPFLRRKDKLYLAFTALMWICFFTTPLYCWLRYTLFFFFLSVVPLAVCIERLGRRVRPLVLPLITVLGTITAVHAVLSVGYGGRIARDPRAYLALSNPYDQTMFLRPHFSIETARTIHCDRIARDVVYTTTHHKYQFHNKRFTNRVVPWFYDTDEALIGFLIREKLQDAAVVTGRGSVQDMALAQSPSFTKVYENSGEVVYTLTQKPEAIQ